MPIPFVIFGMLGVALTALTVFWNQIMDWAQESVIPWFRRKFPSLAPYVEKAFTTLDNVVVKVRRAAKAAWEKIRVFLLQEVIKFRKRYDGKWLRVIESWLMRKDQKVEKNTTTEEVEWSDLPDAVREAMMKKGTHEMEEDVTKKRDQELAMTH